MATLSDEPVMELQLRYTGEALTEGRMSARELGPALFGVAEMLERSAAILNENAPPLRVDVQGNFKRGSFEINFVAAAVQGGLVAGIGAEELSAIVAALGLGYVVGKDALVGMGRGVLGLIRWQRGRKVEGVERPEEGAVRITVTGGDSVTVTTNVYNLYQDAKVRDGFAKLTEPLRAEGVEALRIGAPGEVPAVIAEEEARYFAASLAPAQEPPPAEVTAYVEVVSPNFREGNKWRFDAAGVPFHARVLDEEFLNRVRTNQIRFGQGDGLQVRMRIQKRIIPGGRTETERTVLRVLQHIPANTGEQTSLDIAPHPPPVASEMGSGSAHGGGAVEIAGSAETVSVREARVVPREELVVRRHEVSDDEELVEGFNPIRRKRDDQ